MTRRNFTLVALGSLAARGELRAAPREAGGPLLRFYIEYARLLDERRRQRFADVATAEDVAVLRSEVRAKLASMWGPLPSDEHPLNVRSVGVVHHDDLVVEKIIFESRPGVLIPANLYRPPLTAERLPAAIVACGNDPGGKSTELSQRTCMLLARHGIIALAYDPVGCGERSENLSQDSALQQRGLALQCSALGASLMGYRAWDCRRAIDYLQQRSEVHPEKIAVAGEGAEALQYAAFDDRVAAAFPSGQVVSFKAYIDAVEINQPERVLFGSLREGVEHAELIACMAPKPLVVGAPQRGQLSVAATKRTFDEALSAYQASGAVGVATYVEANEASALGPDLRLAGVDWLSRWLSTTGRTVLEQYGRLIPAAELRCGDPEDGLQSRTVADLNREAAASRLQSMEPPAESSRFEVYKHDIRNRIKAVTRVGSFRPERGLEVSGRSLDAGRYARGVAIVVSELGREDARLRRSVIDPIIAAGYSVVALDLRGWGSGAPQSVEGFDWEDFFADAGLQIGRPLIGQRMKDLLAVPAARIGRRSWTLVGVGQAALVAAQAAAIDDRVDRLITVHGLASFDVAVEDPLTVHPMSSFPPGVIGEYDVRDVYASIAPRPVLALNPVDSKGRSVEEVRAWERFDWVSQTYENIGVPDGFQMQSRLDSSGLRESITNWLQA